MIKIPVLFLLSMTIIISCYVAPAPVFRLQTVPDKNEKDWLHGREFSRLLGKNNDLIIAFDEVRNNVVAFDVEVINRGPESMIMSSELFKGYYLDKKMAELSIQMAIDPEDKLLEMDKALSKENARYAQESGSKAISSFFDLASNVASMGEQKTTKEIERESQENTEEELQDINDDNYHANAITNLTNEKDKWKFSALRKTTLPSNYSISGKIFFPLIPRSHFLRVVLNEENENLSIVFKINKFKSN